MKPMSLGRFNIIIPILFSIVIFSMWHMAKLITLRLRTKRHLSYPEALCNVALLKTCFGHDKLS